MRQFYFVERYSLVGRFIACAMIVKTVKADNKIFFISTVLCNVISIYKQRSRFIIILTNLRHLINIKQSNSYMYFEFAVLFYITFTLRKMTEI